MAVKGDFTDPNSGGRVTDKVYGPPVPPATSVKSIGLAGSTTDDPLVYDGEDHEVGTHHRARTIPQSQAYQQVYQWWGTPRYTQLTNHLIELGLLSENDKDDIRVVASIWKDAVDVSTALGPSKKVSPWSATALMVTHETNGDGAGGGSGKGGTYTSRSVNLTDPNTAKALVNNVLSQALGRAATDDELAQFRSVLNSAERANPSNTTTVVSDDGTAQSSTTTGGLDAAGKEQLLKDQAMQLPDYGAYQASTYYMNALKSLLGG